MNLLSKGIHTTIPFHLLLMDHEVFKKGDFNTNFLKDHPIGQDEEK